MTTRILIVCGGSGAHLLGHRDVLGCRAELYIDLTREVQAHQRQKQDFFSASIAIDQGIGNTAVLFQQARRRLQGDLPPWETTCEYLQEFLSRDSDIRHLQFLIDHTPGSIALVGGMAQLPALGGLAIRHPQNRNALESSLEQVLAPLGIGPENPLEAWIISSTVGGVGGGVHRFVGAFLAEFAQRRFVDTPVILNFVRIGPSAYPFIESRRAAMNTFLGVAADAAFALKMPGCFPNVATHWFYVDFPSGEAEGQRVSEYKVPVEIVTRALMLRELQEDLQRLLTHNAGIPMVLIRAGHWEGETKIDDQRKYYEALCQLREKLQKLLHPNYEQEYSGAREQLPQFAGNEGLRRWLVAAGDREYILGRIEEGWRFPHLPEKYPQNLDEFRDLVEVWKGSLRSLVEEKWYEPKGQWITKEGHPLEVGAPEAIPLGQEMWFRKVQEAHAVRAWTWYLLGCNAEGVPERADGRIHALIASAQRVAAAFRPPFPESLWKRSAKRVEEAAPWLVEFVQLLAEVNALLRLEARAQQFLEQELTGVREIVRVVDGEIQTIQSQFTKPYSEYVYPSDTPKFVPSDALIQWSSHLKEESIRIRLEQGWQCPRRRFPRNLAAVRADIAVWKEAMEALLNLQWERMGVFQIKAEVEGEEFFVSLQQLANGGEDWQRGIENAERARAWAWYLLGCDLEQGLPNPAQHRLIHHLYRRANVIGWLSLLGRVRLIRESKVYLRYLSKQCIKFVTTLAQTEELLLVDEKAADTLKSLLESGEGLLFTRELSEILDPPTRTTWLQAIFRGVHHRAEFQKAVLRGVAGWSDRGLKSALGLSAETSTDEIHRSLASRIRQRERGGGWSEMEGTLVKEWRVLPAVPPTLQESLQMIAKEQGSPFRYVFSSPSLTIMAASGTAFAQALGDVLTAPVSLLRPFADFVKGTISDWDFISPYGVPLKQLEIVYAGVCGEPLYRIAMAEAGLSNEELEKIGQYYPLL